MTLIKKVSLLGGQGGGGGERFRPADLSVG